MAIKGRSYLKTSWSFEERPVSSAKLNTWDDRMEASIELLLLLMNQTMGGGDGVVRGTGLGDLAIQATGTPGLSVEVQPGYAFIDGYAYKLASAVETVDVAIPATQDRIDLVQAKLEDWSVGIKTGAESASP